MSLEEKDNSVVSEEAQESGEKKDTETLKQSLAEAKAKAEANLAGWQRAQADFVNYKRHGEQEREEIAKFANTTLVLELLPILDDLEKASSAVPPEIAGSSWVEGFKLIARKLQAVLEAQGLMALEAVGKPFDPRFHEAVAQGEGEEGIVVMELQKGYQFRDRVIRPSKVIVGKGYEKKEDETVLK